MWLNEEVTMQLHNFSLVSTVYANFHAFINKDTPIYFVNGITTYKEADQLQD